MRTTRTTGYQAFTLLELLVVISVIAILASLCSPALVRAKRGAIRTRCQSNMRQAGLGLLSFASDHDGRFPWEIAPADGGSRDALLYFQHWQAISNELGTLRLLHCPADRNRDVGLHLNEFNSLQISYTLGQQAIPEQSRMILSTDRNLNDSVYDLDGAQGAYWDAKGDALHAPNAGNALLGDGSVHALTDLNLKRALADALVTTGTNEIEFLHPPGAVGGTQ